MYPPPPSLAEHMITVADYACLGEERYLNDSVAEFYLKYLEHEKLSVEDQKRIYIFSSHFFTRLVRDVDLEKYSSANLSLQREMHASVKKWTKNINVFEKNYLLIPINQRYE